MILLIDNYDSFTYNLAQQIQSMGYEVVVKRNDDLDALELLNTNLEALVLSPGPGKPAGAGLCKQLVQQAPQDLPILGICLGHQVIGEVFGYKTVKARRVRHGYIDRIKMTEMAPHPFVRATRYHSLCSVRVDSQSPLVEIGRATDGTVMAFRHEQRPILGLQFHPESYGSEDGVEILARFLATSQLGRQARLCS